MWVLVLVPCVIYAMYRFYKWAKKHSELMDAQHAEEEELIQQEHEKISARVATLNRANRRVHQSTVKYTHDTDYMENVDEWIDAREENNRR